MLATLIVAVCLLLSYPVVELAWADDFSSTKTALDFVHTGRFIYNGWSAPILGWQILWGALWIKLLGFSFLTMRMSVIPLALACVYLFERILENFGIAPRDALLGALTLGVSPLFLPLAESFMTDVPGLLSVLICVWTCQRAVLAREDRHAMAWLIAAALTNAGLGTVRQIVWLGCLVMVPSTAWMLRRRRGVLVGAMIAWLISALAIFACLQWFAKQPYTVPEHVIDGSIRARNLVHLVAQIGKALLCQLLLLLPISVAWFTGLRKLSLRTRLIGLACLAAVCAALFRFWLRGDLWWWIAPWLEPVLASDEGLIPEGIRAIFSVAAAASGIVLLLWGLGRHGSERKDVEEGKPGWSQMVWILGPFTLCYVALLLPRGAMMLIQDRYLLFLMLPCIAFLLVWHRRSFGGLLPGASVVVLLVYAVFAVASNHDSFALNRAIEGGFAYLRSQGIPATQVQAGLGPDGWTQVQHGHINFNKIVVPAHAYDANVPTYGLSERCNYWIAEFTPAIQPRYFVSNVRRDCPTVKVVWEVPYRAWTPPFQRSVLVQALPGKYE